AQANDKKKFLSKEMKLKLIERMLHYLRLGKYNYIQLTMNDFKDECKTSYSNMRDLAVEVHKIYRESMPASKDDFKDAVREAFSTLYQRALEEGQYEVCGKMMDRICKLDGLNEKEVIKVENEWIV